MGSSGNAEYMGRADMSASSDVVWGIIRKNSSFLVKRNFLELSSEPGNLMNKNSFKYSGLANAEAVDIQDNEKGITFSRKNKKNANQPKRNNVSVDLKKDFRKVAKTVRSHYIIALHHQIRVTFHVPAQIMKKTEGCNYRKDLKKPALARWY